HERGRLGIDRDTLEAAENVRHPFGGKLLAGCLGHHIRVSGPGVALTPGKSEGGGSGKGQRLQTTHRTPRIGKRMPPHSATCLRARTSDGISGSPPSRTSLRASGTVRRTSADNWTSSSARLSPDIRGTLPARKERRASSP